MSAYLVGPEHINVLLWAAHKGFRRHPYNLTWTFDNPIRVHQLTDANLDEVGQMLVDGNNASVNHRYGESLEPYEYRYAQPRYTTWSLVEVLKTLECYEYHASEHRDWVTTEAYAFCRQLQNMLVQALHGYDRAPWGIRSTTQPAAHRSAS
jgi:hypothetical protein